MLLKGEFKITEAKLIGAKTALVRGEDRLHFSCDAHGDNPNKTSRHRWLFHRISLGGHGDPPKYIGLYSAK